MSNKRKIKRAKFTVDVLFDEFIEPSHLKVLAQRIVNALRHESDSGAGLGDDNAVPKEIRAFNPDAGIAMVKWNDSEWEESFVNP